MDVPVLFASALQYSCMPAIAISMMSAFALGVHGCAVDWKLTCLDTLNQVEDILPPPPPPRLSKRRPVLVAECVYTTFILGPKVSHFQSADVGQDDWFLCIFGGCGVTVVSSG